MWWIRGSCGLFTPWNIFAIFHNHRPTKLGLMTVLRGHTINSLKSFKISKYLNLCIHILFPWFHFHFTAKSYRRAVDKAIKEFLHSFRSKSRRRQKLDRIHTWLGVSIFSSFAKIPHSQYLRLSSSWILNSESEIWPTHRYFALSKRIPNWHPILIFLRPFLPLHDNRITVEWINFLNFLVVMLRSS